MPDVLLRDDVLVRFVDEIAGTYPKKSFGYFLTEEPDGVASDYYVFADDARADRDVARRFEGQGAYYVNNPDAGFLATAQESVAAELSFAARGLRKVGVFHCHLRHPPYFATIDGDLHPSAQLWHLIISLRNPWRPHLGAYRVPADRPARRVPLVVTGADGLGRRTFGPLDECVEPAVAKVRTRLLADEAVRAAVDVDALGVAGRALGTPPPSLRLVRVGGLEVAATPVTRRAFREVFPGYEVPPGTEDLPVTDVTWHVATRFCELTGTRLPTAPEWEACARDGHAAPPGAQRDPGLDRCAVYGDNSGNRLRPVATRAPNDLGLYDMQGNVWEWCATTGGVAPTKGGSFLAFPEMCRGSVTVELPTTYWARDLGFRVCRTRG